MPSRAILACLVIALGVGCHPHPSLPTPDPDLDVEALRTAAHVVGDLRLFHPSDQVAAADWHRAEVELVDRVLRAGRRAHTVAALQDLVHRLAPTAQLYPADRPPPVRPLPRGPGTHLSRFVHLGVGASSTYASFRTGLSEPPEIGATVTQTVHAPRCGHAQLQLASHIDDGAPILELLLEQRQGSGRSSISRTVEPNGTLESNVSAEVADLGFGVRMSGIGAITISRLELRCDGRLVDTLVAGPRLERAGTGMHLYDIAPMPGGLRIERREDRDLVPRRDQVDDDVGLGLRLRLPLALWTDGSHTWPRAEPDAAPATPVSDRATRIATALDVWLMLRWAYPYFGELHIDWDAALSRALPECDRATTPAALLVALGHLVAALHDDHAEIYRPGAAEGVMPVALHQLGDTLYVVDGVTDAASAVPRGSVLEALDGEPASHAVARAAATISAATPQWQAAMLPLVLGDGPPGTTVTLDVRQPDGVRRRVPLARIARAAYINRLHEPRPASGAELAPHTYYLDAATLDPPAWTALLPALVTATTVIVDLRGGATPTAFQILAHVIDREIRSPFWDIPIIELPGISRYERRQLSILPAAPRLAAQLVFVTDGRTASASETILQYARAAGIGIAIGEPSGGTNGNVATFDTVGGLRVRFTGLRTLNQDGSRLHGIGLAPDIVVHPTPAGLRAGRDELLDRALMYVRTGER